ncbi:MAG: NrsF family protein [Sphingomonas bacterium]|nr:NrsF family protein [Sphingomonas bacterium]
MTVRQTDALIDALSAAASPVERLAPPLTRALGALAGLALVGLIAILLMSNGDPLAMRGAGGEKQAGLELAAALLAGVLAVVAAFYVAIPGRSRAWLVVPLPALALWMGLSGLGCWRDLARYGSSGWDLGHSMDCFAFIIVASLVLGLPLAWRLSRAAPINPLPVALLGSLGIAALSAFLLQFFHPFAVTFLDLAVHLVAVGVVILLASLTRRPMLRPA